MCGNKENNGIQAAKEIALSIIEEGGNNIAILDTLALNNQWKTLSTVVSCIFGKDDALHQKYLALPVTKREELIHSLHLYAETAAEKGEWKGLEYLFVSSLISMSPNESKWLLESAIDRGLFGAVSDSICLLMYYYSEVLPGGAGETVGLQKDIYAKIDIDNFLSLLRFLTPYALRIARYGYRKGLACLIKMYLPILISFGLVDELNRILLHISQLKMHKLLSHALSVVFESSNFLRENFWSLRFEIRRQVLRILLSHSKNNFKKAKESYKYVLGMALVMAITSGQTSKVKNILDTLSKMRAWKNISWGLAVSFGSVEYIYRDFRRLSINDRVKLINLALPYAKKAAFWGKHEGLIYVLVEDFNLRMESSDLERIEQVLETLAVLESWEIIFSLVARACDLFGKTDDMLSLEEKQKFLRILIRYSEKAFDMGNKQGFELLVRRGLLTTVKWGLFGAMADILKFIFEREYWKLLPFAINLFVGKGSDSNRLLEKLSKQEYSQILKLLVRYAGKAYDAGKKKDLSILVKRLERISSVIDMSSARTVLKEATYPLYKNVIISAERAAFAGHPEIFCKLVDRILPRLVVLGHLELLNLILDIFERLKLWKDLASTIIRILKSIDDAKLEDLPSDIRNKLLEILKLHATRVDVAGYGSDLPDSLKVRKDLQRPKAYKWVIINGVVSCIPDEED